MATLRRLKYRIRLWDKETQMAISTCGKCGGPSFELALFTPIGEGTGAMLRLRRGGRRP